MTRRKGEQPARREWNCWTTLSTIAHRMATGDRWFYAWLAQCCTPYAVLSKLTGIPVQRLMVIDQGDRFTRAELEALATAWEVDPETLLGTHPTPGIALIPDGDGGSK